jgi:hypothetical protein
MSNDDDEQNKRARHTSPPTADEEPPSLKSVQEIATALQNEPHAIRVEFVQSALAALRDFAILAGAARSDAFELLLSVCDFVCFVLLSYVFFF